MEQQILPSVSCCEIWHNAVTILGKDNTVVFVKSDVKDAFFSIDVHQLMEQLHQASRNMDTLQL